MPDGKCLFDLLIIYIQVVGPIDPNAFRSFDYEQLGIYELRRRVKPVQEVLANLSIHSAEFDRYAILQSHNISVVDPSRATYSNLLCMTSSLVSSIQQPDPSEQGLFNAMQRPRQRNYRQLQGNYTYV